MPRRWLSAVVLLGIVVVAGCGGSTHSGHSMSGGDMHDMPMPSGAGLAGSVDGYRLQTQQLPMAGMQMSTTFRIVRNDRPITRYEPEQTKLMHFYLIRSDLTGFQHLHPTMTKNGLWSVPTETLRPGTYRMYVQFIPAGGDTMVLSHGFSIAGPADNKRLPQAADVSSVDGYTVRLSGTPRAGAETPMRITIDRAGRPVRDLQSYLDTYAHVTAFHEGDLAFAHLHPMNPVHGPGGPTLTVHAELPRVGAYRMFVQFQTQGRLHTATFTVSAR